MIDTTVRALQTQLQEVANRESHMTPSQAQVRADLTAQRQHAAAQANAQAQERLIRAESTPEQRAELHIGVAKTAANNLHNQIQQRLEQEMEQNKILRARVDQLAAQQLPPTMTHGGPSQASGGVVGGGGGLLGASPDVVSPSAAAPAAHVGSIGGSTILLPPMALPEGKIPIVRLRD